MKWLKWLGVVVAILLVLLLAMFFFGPRPNSRPQILPSAESSESSALPQFIQADWIDLSKVASISQFRSGAGHSFVDRSESCRSMKHYYNLASTLDKSHGWQPGDAPPPAPNEGEGVAIYSPMDGEITDFDEENVDFGLQIRLKPVSQPK